MATVHQLRPERARGQDADLEATSDVWPVDATAAPRDAAFAIHDAKNMLAVISANVEFVVDSLGPAADAPGMPSAIEDLRTATSRAAMLLRDALLTLRGAAERREAPARMRVGAVISTAVARFRRRADAIGVTIDLRGEAELRASIEPDLLERVLDNLLDNALRFSKAGDVIEVRCASARGRLVVSVADQGPGIRQDEREAVFTSYRVTASTEGHFGLGLAFCRAVARDNGGDVYVENRPEGGARFVLEVG
jgi:signal transduction histidine kinase